MRSIRTKLLLALLIITLLPVYPLYHLVKDFFSRSLEVGFNEKVIEALENASGLSQIVFSQFREETLDLCRALKRSIRSPSLFKSAGRIKFNFTPIEKKYGAFRLQFYDKKGVFLRQHFSGAVLVYPAIYEAQLHAFQVKTALSFFETNPQPAFISVYVPAIFSNEKTGAMVVTRPLPTAFVEQSRQVIEVNQMFQAIGILRGDLEKSFILAFFVIYLSFTVLIIVLGYLFYQRISRPLIALAAGTEKVAAGDLDYRMQVKSGDEIGKLVDSFNSMIEKVKTKQEQVVELEKKAAWREMARILAHEIKNPLTPMQLTVQQLRDEYKGDDPLYSKVLAECTEIISDEIAALQKLVRTFSEFARMPEMQLVQADLNELIRDVRKLYKDADVDLDLSSNLPLIKLDDEQFRRILKNLFKNSLDSIKEKGAGRISISTVFQNETILIGFSDTGMGIKDEILPRIFEPHYSTKKQSMGLGLAIVKRIILEHGGSISVESQTGKGTRFSIILPT